MILSQCVFRKVKHLLLEPLPFGYLDNWNMNKLYWEFGDSHFKHYKKYFNKCILKFDDSDTDIFFN